MIGRFLSFTRGVCVLSALFCVFVTGAVAASPAPGPPAGMANLSQNEPYTIAQLLSTQYSYAATESTYYKQGALTDGLIGSSTTFSDGQWQGYLRGASRTIIIDMGHVNSVMQIQERFMSDPSAGISFPRYVTYALSVNDTDWADAGTVKSAIPLDTSGVTVQTYAVTGFNCEARYVKMTFPVDVWVFADEFQVFGESGVTDSTTVPQFAPPPATAYANAYCPPGSPAVGGTRNMVLIYNGYYASNPAAGENTVDELTPYVGYENTSGKTTDFMFDGFLFCPYVAGGPSGGGYYCDPAHPTVESDWQYYLDNTFDSTYNLGALNTAVGNAKKTLGDSSYEAKVEIAIPYPTPTETDFGRIDSSGKSLDFAYLADREAAIKWYVDSVMTKWSAAGYANLDFVGFYWYQEEAEFDVGDSEAAMLRFTGNYVRSLGKVLDWIPQYQAAGLVDWDSLGFDAAVMQPNYAFHSWPEQELANAAGIIKKLGMGIEIEVPENLSSLQNRDKYYTYLNYGVTEGYMTRAVHMYYQGGGPGAFYDCSKSSDQALRSIYDRTYDFIKGTYIPTLVEGERSLPKSFQLMQNYPNPFNPATKIEFSLRRSGVVSLRIYNVLGELVKTVDKGYKPAGRYMYSVNMNNYASGAYFYSLREDGNVITKKLVLLK